MLDAPLAQEQIRANMFARGRNAPEKRERRKPESVSTTH